MRPLFLGLRKGGKGVATALGLLLATLGPRSPLVLVSVVIAMFVFWTHRSNIGRLRRGEEHRFGKGGGA